MRIEKLTHLSAKPALIGRRSATFHHPSTSMLSPLHRAAADRNYRFLLASLLLLAALGSTSVSVFCAMQDSPGEAHGAEEVGRSSTDVAASIQRPVIMASLSADHAPAIRFGILTITATGDI